MAKRMHRRIDLKCLCRLSIAILFLGMVLMECGHLRVSAATEPPEVSAHSAILIAADSGEIIFEKNAHEELAMASTTKIMTALLALEEAEANGNPQVEITGDMTAVEGSSMGLRAGDVLYLEGIVAGMMMASGNDAANAAALYISGSQEAFSERMNQKAKAIGMLETNFVTPSGLDDDAHYSTAYDMALLGAYAIQQERFRNICSSKSCAVEFVNPSNRISFSNHNRLLSEYEGCIGIKTGFTKKAGRCLVSAAERDGILLVCVTLNAPNDWEDHRLLFDYGFAHTQVSKVEDSFSYTIPIVGSEKETLSASTTANETVTLLKESAGQITCIQEVPRFIYAPVRRGDTVGRISYYLNEKKLFSIPLTADEAVDYTIKTGFFDKFFHKEK